MECYVFTELTKNPVVQGLLQLRDGKREGYFQAFPTLLEFSCREAYTSHTVREYLMWQLLDSPNAGRYIHHSAAATYLQEDLIQICNSLINVDWDSLCGRLELLPFPCNSGKQREPGQCPYPQWVELLLQASTTEEILDGLRGFFSRFEDSSEAKYTAFSWSGRELEGICHPDSLTFAQLGGLEYQKQTLIDNTRCFLSGGAANDILLVGGSGTGKSSSVKATLNLFAGERLRLVELTKREISTLPRLLQTLRGKKCHYIVFIDDLSFESPDEGYLELKVALDGQVEKRPGHILIYATSNRRRLVRETWKDREADDVHENDTLHEKLSLSERFGIRLYFPVLSQGEYFDIVRLLLEQRGVAWSEEIGKLAATWATQYNGRSGRTAKQFVADYCGSC